MFWFFMILSLALPDSMILCLCFCALLTFFFLPFHLIWFSFLSSSSHCREAWDGNEIGKHFVIFMRFLFDFHCLKCQKEIMMNSRQGWIAFSCFLETRRREAAREAKKSKKSDRESLRAVTKQLNAEKILLHGRSFHFVLFFWCSPPFLAFPSPFPFHSIPFPSPLIAILIVVIRFMPFPFIYNPLPMVRKKGTSVLIFGSGEKEKANQAPASSSSSRENIFVTIAVCFALWIHEQCDARRYVKCVGHSEAKRSICPKPAQSTFL